MKKWSILILAVCCFSCGQLQQVVNNFPDSQGNAVLGQAQIASGLKEALKQGISQQVSKLAKKNGFYNNQLTRILLPKDLQKVAKGLRSIGLGSLVDKGIKALNHTAEDAVSRATPIFVNAITQMNFADAKTILLGNDLAATTYLKNKTQTQLYKEFQPEIAASFNRVGANKIWANLITKYNAIPLVDDVNPNLTDYVTQQALKGVYTMIGKEEQKIRNNIGARSSQLLRKVFALQD